MDILACSKCPYILVILTFRLTPMRTITLLICLTTIIRVISWLVTGVRMVGTTSTKLHMSKMTAGRLSMRGAQWSNVHGDHPAFVVVVISGITLGSTIAFFQWSCYPLNETVSIWTYMHEPIILTFWSPWLPSLLLWESSPYSYAWLPSSELPLDWSQVSGQ